MRSNLGKVAYQLSALMARFTQSPVCPSCGSTNYRKVDRKGVLEFNECQNCYLLFMFPSEAAAQQTYFYQNTYAEPGLITDLPSDAELDQMIRTNFADSSKDFSYHIKIFKSLGIQSGAKVLDFGASWGYGAYQFRSAGYQTSAFELSKPRAEFGRKLGIEISSDLAELQAGMDLVYSCHVLEHVPNPSETLRKQYDLLEPGGYLAAHTPNGSKGWRERNVAGFKKAWGRVHPVLLSVDYVVNLFKTEPVYISSNDDPKIIGQWDQRTRHIDACSDAGFFFVIRKASE